MVQIKTVKFALGELAEKCRIVADEPDLQESYGVTEEEANNAASDLTAMERAGMELDTSKFSTRVLVMLAGEAANAAVVQRDIAKDARENLSKQYSLIQKGARELELLSDALKAAAK